ncbi:MAG TPA: FHA domain-containing serine/threonine-protein kinase, partial [Gemmataceae bacterium]|nr:FHA domain-containing serine/threonine-protein kinase [Gemmataceae bacterium]
MNPNDPDKTLPPKADGLQPEVRGLLADLGLPASAATVAAPSWPGKDGVFGRYKIEKKLGEGGMGAVYLAHDTTLDRPVALKIPLFSGNVEVAAARFMREARAAAGLTHPNICPIYDVGEIHSRDREGGRGESNSTHFLAMSFVKGETLAEKVKPGTPMDPTDAARIVRTIATAMQYAHSRGVIHRDLKPVNVMIDDRGEPVVMDFGLARRSTEAGVKLTLQGDVMGTPAYMSPEQVAGDVAKMGPGCDIYSLGVVLYQLLTGDTPFRGDLFALLSQIALDQPQPPSARRPGLDPRFDSICLKALAKKPEERWKSMQMFADVLGGVSQQRSVSEGPQLTFKVEGTNFAYRPPAVLPVVTVGRQKRKVGDAPDQGSDFVLRVAGNDGLSARISRRHFEVHRTPTGFAVVDRSKAGLTRNGTPLPKDTPVELNDGDRLGVAGVVTLEVVIRVGGDEGVKLAAAVEVPAPPSSGGGRVQIEA